MSDGRIAWMLFIAALLGRVVCAMGAAFFGTDSTHFLLMADWMREGRFREALEIGYHPLYPLLIAGMRTFTVSSESAGEAVSALLGAAGVFPLFHMIRSVFSRPAAFIASLLYAFSPAYLVIQADVMTEGTYMFFIFLSMWLTWRAMEEPSLVRGAAVGVAAAGAFLTRLEGVLAIVLAVAWPAIDLFCRRERVWRRVGSIVLTAAMIVALLMPFLLWVKSARGRWALSTRVSAISVEQAVGVTGYGKEGELTGATRRHLYGLYLRSLLHLSLSGALVPFYALGAAGIARLGWRKGLFYFSFPVGLLGGTLWALRTHNFMADRYLYAGMALLGGLAGSGAERVIAWSSRRWPTTSWRPVATMSIVAVVAIAPGLRFLSVRRSELLSVPVAVRWILEHGPKPRGITGALSQVAYYCGCRHYYAGETREDLDGTLKLHPLDYYVYSERDVQSRPEIMAIPKTSPRLEPPVEIEGPPHTLKIYIQRVK
jgi:4-amino-4-deoxy-L-arabinose transferase-like glycosyltransferase